MKKLILFMLISLLLIPNLASAFWYTNVKVEKNISESLIAGSTDSIIVSFKNNLPLMASLIARINATSEVGIGENDFTVEAILNSTSFYPAYPESASSEVNVNCIQKEAGIFYCFNLTEVVIKRCIEFFKKERGICFTEGKNFVGSYIVLPKSKNDLTFYITFNPALIPANYSFKVDLFSDFGIPKIIDPIEHFVEENNLTLFNASIADTLLWITGKENKSLSVDVILYEFVLQEEEVPKDLIPIKFVGIETNDNENVAFVEIRIYYNESELPEWCDESSLRLYFYNDTDSNPENWKWEKIENSGVNEGEDYVWGRLDHLSLFGILGSLTETAPPTPATGGGGGGGGGGGVPLCTPDWRCTEWSKCSKEGIQTRKCTDKDKCRTTAGKPAETQSCDYVPPKTTEAEEEAPTEEVEPAPAEEPPETGAAVTDTTRGLGGITGRFFQDITGITNKWMGLGVTILVFLVGCSFYFFVIKKKRKKE